jgi:hypothetical protein
MATHLERSAPPASALAWGAILFAWGAKAPLKIPFSNSHIVNSWFGMANASSKNRATDTFSSNLLYLLRFSNFYTLNQAIMGE